MHKIFGIKRSPVGISTMILGETTADGRFTMKEVECLGACGMGPCMQLGKHLYEHLAAGRWLSGKPREVVVGRRVAERLGAAGRVEGAAVVVPRHVVDRESRGTEELLDLVDGDEWGQLVHGDLGWHGDLGGMGWGGAA